MIRWYRSVCESVTSKSLVIEVREFPQEFEFRSKMQVDHLCNSRVYECFATNDGHSKDKKRRDSRSTPRLAICRVMHENRPQFDETA